jgi:hypothetical protein
MGQTLIGNIMRLTANSNTKLHDIIKMADIVHPWTPGIYGNLIEVDHHRENYTKGDKAWCDRYGLLYMPVVFPGSVGTI